MIQMIYRCFYGWFKISKGHFFWNISSTSLQLIDIHLNVAILDYHHWFPWSDIPAIDLRNDKNARPKIVLHIDDPWYEWLPG